jgi:hypothetical protein
MAIPLIGFRVWVAGLVVAGAWVDVAGAVVVGGLTGVVGAGVDAVGTGVVGGLTDVVGAGVVDTGTVVVGALTVPATVKTLLAPTLTHDPDACTHGP